MENDKLDYDVFASKCPSRNSFDQIFGKWGMLIISYLMKGSFRFGEIHRAVDGISERMLSKSLKLLEDEGIVIREDFNEKPPRVIYSLSNNGKLIGEAVNMVIERLYRALEERDKLK